MMLDEATKPFECLGTVEEVQLALDLLAVQDGWQDAAAVRALGDAAAQDREGRLAAALLPDATITLPAPFDRWLDELVGPTAATGSTGSTGRSAAEGAA